MSGRTPWHAVEKLSLEQAVLRGRVIALVRKRRALRLPADVVVEGCADAARRVA